MKADDKYDFEDDGEKAKYSNFEALKAKVEVLQEQLDIVCKILKHNNMTGITEKYEMVLDYDDEMFKKLE